jgi:hypothetical protein
MGFSLPAHAKNVRKSKSILPPPEFDHLYEGNIRVKRDSAWAAPCRPISLSGRLGCAFPPDKPNDECFVFSAPREDVAMDGRTISHCEQRGMKKLRKSETNYSVK